MENKEYIVQTARDITKDKNLDQLLGLIGNYFCEPDTHKSYRIIGLNKNGFICHKTIGLYDEDAFFGSGYYAENGYIEVKFTDNEFAYSLPATQKQKDWLYKHEHNTDVGGVEAWNIIHEAVEEAQREYKRRKYEYEHRWDYLDHDDDMDLCDYYDVPNM